MGKDHAQPMDVDPTASQKENTFANVVAQEELPCQDVNELILRFKRKGIFDEMRKVAFAEFKESKDGMRFQRQVMQLCEDYVSNRDRRLDDLDRATLQRRLIRDLESIQDAIEDQLKSKESKYQEQIIQELNTILDTPQEWVDKKIVGREEQRQLASFQETVASLNIIDEILSYAPKSKEKEKEPQPVLRANDVRDDVELKSGNDRRLQDHVEAAVVKVSSNEAAMEEELAVKKEDHHEERMKNGEDPVEEKARDPWSTSSSDLSSIASTSDEDEVENDETSVEDASLPSRNLRNRESVVPKRAAQKSKNRMVQQSVTSDEDDNNNEEEIEDQRTTSDRRKRRSSGASSKERTKRSKSEQRKQRHELSSIGSDSEKDVSGDPEREQEKNEELYSQVYLRGQKLAAMVPNETDPEKSGANRCVVCIVKSFDEKTGLYTVNDQTNKNLLKKKLEELVHFNHNVKTFHVGDTVYALFRSKLLRGLSNEFFKAKVARVNNNVIHVAYADSKDSAVLRYNELFKP